MAPLRLPGVRLDLRLKPLRKVVTMTSPRDPGRRRWILAVTGTSLVATFIFSVQEPSAMGSVPVGVTTLVSVSSDGVQGNGGSSAPSLSGSGRYVAFSSYASNLVAGDSNNRPDVFVVDRATGTTRRVSVSSDETEGTGEVEAAINPSPTISADGEHVAFRSDSPNLVPGDTNDVWDVFVRDRATGTTHRVSVTSRGRQAQGPSDSPVISSHGRFVAFASRAGLAPGANHGAVFVRDRLSRTTRLVSVTIHGGPANGSSEYPAISGHGGNVAFYSEASNLVRGDHNGVGDVFVREATGVTRRVSVSSAGTGGNGLSSRPAISAHGRYIAFESVASNLVPGDTNQRSDVFVQDLKTGTTRRVSVASSGSQADGDSSNAVISSNGRYVAYDSSAANLTAGTDGSRYNVFVRDRWAGTTTLVSAGGDADSGGAAFSRDGRHIAFGSAATNLVTGDANGFADVFLRRMSR